MSRDFNNDDFEFFLKEKVDHYKMYPSDRVWKGVYSFLHTRKKWFTIGGSFLLVTVVYFLGQAVLVSNPSRTINKKAQPAYTTTPASTKLSSLPSVQKGKMDVNALLTRNITVSTAYSAKNSSGKASSTYSLTPFKKFQPVAPGHESIEIVVPENYRDFSALNSELNLANASINTRLAMQEDADASDHGINWLQEMAVIKLTAGSTKRLHLQFYFSPTISYRKLADNKNSIKTNQQNIPLAADHLNVNGYVDHKPSIGAELGSNILFTPSKNLTLKTGLQLNYSRYGIKAFRFYPEKASIALNSFGPVADTLTAYTSFRNFNGYYPEELQNQYFQVSLPIGAELKLLGNSRLQVNIAGSVQPTYLLFNDTYLLSTDYVNYAKESSLVRKWNVHTSVEAFVSYQSNGVRWQVGPQFRYQLMSSYDNLYPIREYLTEYGIKFGVSKTIR